MSTDLAYVVMDLDSMTGADRPPVSRYATLELDPHMDVPRPPVLHVKAIVVILDAHGHAATANGVTCVPAPGDPDGLPAVPVVAGVAYAVSAPGVLRETGQIPALTAGQVVNLSSVIVPGAPLTPDQAAALAARVTALEATPPGSGVTDHGALTGLADDDHPNYLTTGRGDARYVQGTDSRLSDARTPTAHTHTSAQVTDLTEAVQDAVAALLVGASGVTLSYDDAANTLTITGPGASGLDAEAVRDAIGVALIGTGLISVAVNDAADTITISTTATANATDAALRDRTTHTGAQAISTVTGLQAALDGKAPSVHTHTAAQVSDSTTTGRALVTATDAAAARGTLGLGTAATTAATAYATAAQGAKADTAVQPGALATVATTGAYADLSGRPTVMAPTAHTHGVTDLTATGTRDATTYLRGDGTWATPGGGGGDSDIAGSYDAGRWYSLGYSKGFFAASVGNYQQLILVPIVVGSPLTVSALSVVVTAAGGAGSVLRCGFYTRTGSTMTRVGGEVALPTDSTGVKAGLISGAVIPPGPIWLGWLSRFETSQPPSMEAVNIATGSNGFGAFLTPTASTSASDWQPGGALYCTISSPDADLSTAVLSGSTAGAIPVFSLRSA